MAKRRPRRETELESSPVAEQGLVTEQPAAEVEDAGGVEFAEAIRAEEAGVVSSPDEVGYSFEERERKTEDTAATIALILVWVLAGSIIVHYIAVGLAIHGGADQDQLDSIERIYNTLLPVISGLVGSAVAYYFGRERRLKKA